MSIARLIRWSTLCVVIVLLAFPVTALAQPPLPNTFVSQDGSITFDYPEGWIVTEDPYAGIMLATSQTALDNADAGTLVTGDVAIMMAPPSMSAMLMSAGGITADTSITDALTALVGVIEGNDVPAFGTPVELDLGGVPAARVDGMLDDADYMIALIQFSPDTYLISVGISAPGTMSQFDDTLDAILASVSFESPWLQAFAGHTDYVNGVAFSPDGTTLVSGSDDGTVRLWDVASGEARVLEGHEDYVNGVAFSPDGLQVASASDDYSARVWDVASGETVVTFSTESDSFSSVAFSPDGSKVAAGDAGAWILDAATGEILVTLDSGFAYPLSVAFSPDGATLATGNDDGMIWLWDVVSGTVIRTLEGHTDYVRSVAWSPDGTQIASGSDDYSVRTWDVATGEELLLLQGHTDWVRGVAWSPDGTRLASGSDDQTVWLWDAATGEPQAVLRGHSDYVNSVAFSPDSTLLASASDDGMILLWDATKTTDIPVYAG
ncbi:WD40 repeat domain-containing protein [Aggregatilinea lenta]|uniref:WD40 repeat domain-containing protein n=1 Tax=Aggregatilinea lenta TaxID=913108 RepID=UPI0013C371AE|nr:WD40 repeat domain-containing protein [Aggregatilinea lenta]